MIAPSGRSDPPLRLAIRAQDNMPDIEKEEAIALFQRGNRSVELIQDWSPEALADLIASIKWNEEGAREVKGALQALYEQRRAEQARRERVRRVRRLAVGAVVVAVLILLLWEEYGRPPTERGPPGQRENVAPTCH